MQHIIFIYIYTYRIKKKVTTIESTANSLVILKPDGLGFPSPLHQSRFILNGSKGWSRASFMKALYKLDEIHRQKRNIPPTRVHSIAKKCRKVSHIWRFQVHLCHVTFLHHSFQLKDKQLTNWQKVPKDMEEYRHRPAHKKAFSVAAISRLSPQHAIKNWSRLNHWCWLNCMPLFRCQNGAFCNVGGGLLLLKQSCHSNTQWVKAPISETYRI